MTYKIREHRERLNMTQEELAKRSGVTRVTIIALERKRPYTTTTDTLQNVAKALGVKVTDIICD